MSIRLWFVFLLGLLVSAGAPAKPSEVPLEELQPSRDHRQAALIITKVVNKYHYQAAPLDDALSAAMFKRYLESLDPNRSYFTQQDLEGFEHYRTELDDALREADLEPGFRIFRIFRLRVERMVAYAEKMLEQEFDFTRDEAYRFDRSDTPWAEDTKALEELWRKRVKNDVLSLRLADKPEDEIKETLHERYQGILRRTAQLNADDVFRTFINAYTLALEPHTSYMSPRVAENFDINMRLSLEGIGAVLSIDNEYTEVERVLPGGPAGVSGQLHEGDRIAGVAQGHDGAMEDVVGWRLQDVVDLIRGPKGSVVRLRILPKSSGSDGPSKEIELVRNEIKLEDQAAQSYTLEGLEGMQDVRIGVIEVPTFYRDFEGYSEGNEDFRSTTKDVRRLLGEFKDQRVDGVVIDLRGNGGGALTEATELTGLFIPEGPVVQVKRSDGSLDIEQDPDPALFYDGPLALMVDRYSASASEIFAGAIQDYGRGIIIGEPTFGKGTVQTLIDLNRFVFRNSEDLGRLRLTMAQFFRVNGGSTQFKGVVPDIVLPTSTASEDHGERSLENALPWGKIDAADYRKVKLGPLDSLRVRHGRRIVGDAAFQLLVAEEGLVQEAKEKKAVSLNERERRKEWDRREAERKRLNNELRAAVGLAPEPEDGAEEPDKSSAEREDERKRVERIAAKEAARILADYVTDQRPRSAMVD